LAVKLIFSPLGSEKYVSDKFIPSSSTVFLLLQPMLQFSAAGENDFGPGLPDFS
jgi:hypothetical protein